MINAKEAAELSAQHAAKQLDAKLTMHVEPLVRKAAEEGKLEVRLTAPEFPGEAGKLADLGYVVKAMHENRDGPTRPGYDYILISWGDK